MASQLTQTAEEAAAGTPFERMGYDEAAARFDLTGTDYDRLDPRDLAGIAAGDANALEWASVPNLTRVYLANTSDDELLGLVLLLEHRVAHGSRFSEDPAAKLEKVNRELESR